LADRLSSRRRSEPSRRWLRIAMAVLASIGAVDTGLITLKRWGMVGPLICLGGGDGCDKVLSSAWGSLFGQPLSLFGFLAYASVLVLSVLLLVLRADSRGPFLQLCWSGLFLSTLGMSVFSLLLMGVMVFRIQAFCAFCLMSALLSLALLVLSLIGNDWEDRGQLVFSGVMVGLLVLLGGLAWATAVGSPAVGVGRGVPIPVRSASTPATIQLAEKLSASGVKMYSAYWCPHCHEQKEMFGKEASARLTIIECAPDGLRSQAALCASKKIEGYPSWEIAGRIESGVKPLLWLADKVGFKGL
jgi:uncharacterized membrane protein